MTAAPRESKTIRMPAPPPDDACQVFEHQSTELVVQCQALAGQGSNDIIWPATVRHISIARIGLVLVRRFEPQTGLSLSLPDSGSDSVSSVFARVSHVESYARLLAPRLHVCNAADSRATRRLLASRQRSASTARRAASGTTIRHPNRKRQ